MKIAVLKEANKEEKRVAITPETVKKYVALGIKVYIEKGAGLKAGISDEEYAQAGAKTSTIPLELLGDADILLQVQASSEHHNNEALQFLRAGTVVLSLLDPYNNKNLVKKYQAANLTAFALELIPRISRAQTMDVLSSQANLAGYRAVIEAASELDRMIPMIMTAAGTISPARFLILGAGVAGLQAIATAKRLGGIIHVFDVRAAAKEQVESLGGKFIEVAEEKDSGEGGGGYAKEMDAAYKAKQASLIAKHVKASDVVISTALIPGKKAPILITDEMVESMRSGAVIVDLAALAGGNCSKTAPGKAVTYQGKKIIGYTDMLSRIAFDASKLFANNLYSFISLLYQKENNILHINLEDEIIAQSLVTYKGKLMRDFIGGHNE